MSTEVVIISVGTDHHPFARLVGWSTKWALDHPECKVIIQRGTSAKPADVESHELIPHDELRELFCGATAVVSHGGPSTLMDARMSGRFPIVVPRNPKLDEHLDDHQMRFAEHMARHGMARLAHTEAEFRAALADVLADPDAYTVPFQDMTMSSRVVRFGEVVDELLGIQTPLRLYDLGGTDERQTVDRRDAERRNEARRIQARREDEQRRSGDVPGRGAGQR